MRPFIFVVFFTPILFITAERLYLHVQQVAGCGIPVRKVLGCHQLRSNDLVPDYNRGKRISRPQHNRIWVF